MPKQISVIADSTFYICFLDDIKRPDCLISICGIYTFHVPPKVLSEITASGSYNVIKDNKSIVPVLDNYNYSEILRPFFGKRQIEKGESEAVALAYIWYKIGRCDKLVLDDGEARGFVSTNMPELITIMIGTVAFLGDCHCISRIFSKEDALQMLHLIEHSKFRIKDKDLNKIKQRIEGC